MTSNLLHLPPFHPLSSSSSFATPPPKIVFLLVRDYYRSSSPRKYSRTIQPAPLPPADGGEGEGEAAHSYDKAHHQALMRDQVAMLNLYALHYRKRSD